MSILYFEWNCQKKFKEWGGGKGRYNRHQHTHTHTERDKKN